MENGAPMACGRERSMDEKLESPREVRSREVSWRSWRDLSMADCILPGGSGGEVVKRTKGKRRSGHEVRARGREE